MNALKKYIFQFFLVLIICLTFSQIFQVAYAIAPSQDEIAANKNPLSAKVHIKNQSLHPGEIGEIQFQLELAPGFHAYEDKFSAEVLEPSFAQIANLKLNNVEDFFDKFSKANRRGFSGSTVAVAALSISEHVSPSELDQFKKLNVAIHYQACADSFCLFPKTIDVESEIKVVATQNSGSTTKTAILPTTSTPNEMSQWSIAQALEHGLFIAFVVAFLAGFLTSLTPCIFPMIPITIAILGQQSEKRSRAENVLISFIYVLGIATTYSLLGVIAASTGSLFGAALSNPIALATMSFMFFAFSLSMYGFYEIKTPHFIEKRIHHKKKHGHLGTYFYGMVAGVVASPCVGPVLVSILTYVAQTRNQVLGFALLFTYALGMGVLFMLLGATTEITRRLPRSGPWMNGVKFIFGTMMLGAAYYYLHFIIAQRWFFVALGIGGVVLSSLSGAFSAPGKTALHHLRKGVFMALFWLSVGSLVYGALNLGTVPAANISSQELNANESIQWMNYNPDLLAQAKERHKVLILDFYADWCAACHELDEKTYSDVNVRNATRDFMMVKFNATQDSAELKKLLKQYHIPGLPTVLFFDESGRWREDLTLSAFEQPDEFVKRIEKIHSR